jgi:hypothetical protein
LDKKPTLLPAFTFIGIVIFSTWVYLPFWGYTEEKFDLHILWMQSTYCYFPAFYYVGLTLKKVGFESFEEWAFAVKSILLLFNFGIGFLIYHLLNNIGKPWIGVFGSAFWFLNRWTILVFRVGQLDFFMLFFLIASLYFHKKRRKLSWLLLGAAISFKPFIFFVPVYLLKEKSLNHILVASFYILLIPLIISIPFVILSAKGFVTALLFSLTRNPNTFLVSSGSSSEVKIGYGLEGVLGEEGIITRSALLTLMIFFYYCVYKYNLKLIYSIFVASIIFIAFSPVLFDQYFCWFIPLLPLLYIDTLPSDSKVFPR